VPPRHPHGTRPPGADTSHRGSPDAAHRAAAEGAHRLAADAVRRGAVEGVHRAAATEGGYGPVAPPVIFRAGCPHCRENFQLTADALRLAIGASARTTFYSFTCPCCGEPVRKPAGERIVELLTRGGVRTMRLA
jgi:hypothetical protein